MRVRVFLFRFLVFVLMSRSHVSDKRLHVEMKTVDASTCILLIDCRGKGAHQMNRGFGSEVLSDVRSTLFGLKLRSNWTGDVFIPSPSRILIEDGAP